VLMPPSPAIPAYASITWLVHDSPPRLGADWWEKRINARRVRASV
jgi:hypothetical protein